MTRYVSISPSFPFLPRQVREKSGLVLTKGQCPVSAEIESALVPLVTRFPAIHFVKVHYADIEFDNAAVPAVLAYRNQGDLFANLTGIIEMIPDEDGFDCEGLQALFRQHGIV